MLDTRAESIFTLTLGHLVCVMVTGRDKKKVKEKAGEIATGLVEQLSENEKVLGPAAARILRAKKMYRYRALVKCPTIRPVTEAYRRVLRTVRIPYDVKVGVDVDPVSVD